MGRKTYVRIDALQDGIEPRQTLLEIAVQWLRDDCASRQDQQRTDLLQVIGVAAYKDCVEKLIRAR